MIADLVYAPLLALWWLSTPLRALVARLRGRTPKARAPLGPRFGGFPSPPGEKRSIWIHAVSFGEVLAARALVRALEARWPDRPLVITTTTLTGLAAAREHFPRHTVSPSPLDFSFVQRRAFRAFRPALLVLVELDFWPNQMVRALREGVPAVVANGKLSERSARGYRRLRRIWRRPFDALRVLALQTETVRNRWLEVGLESERLRVIGSTKVDNLAPPADSSARTALRAVLGLTAERVWVAGSTHEGEESVVLQVFSDLRAKHPDLRLVLAPRHPERLDGVESLVLDRGLRVRRRSVPGAEADTDVVLLDTMGELATVFGLADVVFLGGSLVPVGGHNVLEPAAAGRPQIVGPHVESVADEVAALEALGALRRVEDAAGLEEALADWLDKPAEAAIAGRAAESRIATMRGATEETIEILADLVEDAERDAGGAPRTRKEQR